MIRLPAEWEAHKATWLAWPENEFDWLGQIEPVRQSYISFINELTKHEIVELIVSSKALLKGVDFKNLSKINVHELKTNRSWLRDSAPTAVFKDRKLTWINWDFNAWAKYEDYQLDQKVGDFVINTTGFDSLIPLRPDGTNIVMEGGVFDGNGVGTLMVTEECLLSRTQERNPGFGKAEYQELFAKYLGIEEVVWLKAGVLGDDTHGHIDDVCRFVAEDVVVLATAHKYDHDFQKISRENQNILEKSRNSKGEKLQLALLPMPEPISCEGDRLPASYANFYIGNEAVYVPAFKDKQDDSACRVLEELLPRRSIIPINSREFIIGLGTLHCSTQQQPVEC